MVAIMSLMYFTKPPVIETVEVEKIKYIPQIKYITQTETQTEYIFVVAEKPEEPGETPQAKPETEAPEKDGMTYLGNFYITGYDPYCKHCCSRGDGITASGEAAEVGKTIAMKGIPFGTRILIDGLGEYIVQDRGVGDGVIDVACDGHDACYEITGLRDVWIID